MDAIERLDSLKLPNEALLGVKQVALVLGVTPRRVRVLVKPKNSITPSRIKSHFNELHGAYEVKVGDLRDFIVSDYAIAKPGRPKRKNVL